MKLFTQKKYLSKVMVTLSFLFLVPSLFSCSQTSFSPADNSALSTPVLFENTYKVSPSEVQFTQPNLAENKTTLSFQAKDGLGAFIETLLKSQLVLKENGQVITDFNLSKNSVVKTTPADIIFTVDVTGSMEPTIEAAKARLVNFVRDTRAKGYHTRMCLSTFGDYTVSKCTRFYNNDPKDPSTETEMNELISEITKLKALKGPQDPGGRDFDENPMRAIIDNSLAPWSSEAQHFVILVTDAAFLYSPGNSGDVGLLAPVFTDVLAAITQAKMKIFAVTPSKSGYEKNFNSTTKGIVEHSGGQWYKFSDLMSGQITLTTVLNNIISSIDTTYVVDYTLTSGGKLDPSKPLSQRNITLELISSVLGNVMGLTVNSNLPNGRVPDPKRFVISDRKVNPDKIAVFVNDVQQIGNYVLINQKEIEFEDAQKANSKIKVRYEYESIKDSIRLTPIYVSVGADKIPLLKFEINGIYVDPKYYTVVPIELNLASIIINDNVFDKDDPFKINATGVLDISIRTK